MLHEAAHFSKLKKFSKFLVKGIAFCALVSLIIPTAISAAPGSPAILNHQGRLLDASGNLLGGASGTNYCFRFSLYGDETVGAPDSQLWPASTPQKMTVLVKNGVFNVGIGDTNVGGDDLSTYDFNATDTTYLNIEVAESSGGSCAGVSSFENLSPRQRIASAASALNSNTVGGFTPSQTPTGNNIPVLTDGNLFLAGTVNGLAIAPQATGFTLTGGTITKTLTIADDATISGTNTGDNATNSQYASDYRAANFVAGTDYLTPTGSAAGLTSFPAFNQNTTGNAATATALATGRTINGVTFDGTTNITIADATKVVANTAITGATKTKITYDAKGLVISGTDATTADIADSLDKRYVTDAGLTVLGNTSGTNTGDQDLSPYLLISGLAAAETDPIFAASSAFNISAGDITNLGNLSGTNTGDNATNSQYSGLAASKADVGQIFYIGTTQIPINRTSGALTLAGITLTTPDLGTPSALVGTNITGTASGLSIGGNAATVTNGVYTTDAGTVFLAPNGSAALLTSFPTLNQNTTGSAATLTTPRTIFGISFDGSANIGSALGTGAYATIADYAPLASPTFTGTVSGITAAMVGAPSGSGTSSGTNTGDQTSVTGNAGTVTFADAAGDTTTFLALGTGATGSLAPATDAGLTYNATTDALSTTTFIGALTGNVTGNVSGSSGSTTGNAATATALAANPSDCGANTFATTIAANGNLTCASILDADIPNNITVDLATLASAVTNATLTTALTVNTGTVTLVGNVANSSVLTLGAGASSFSGTSSGTNTGDQTSVTGNAGTVTFADAAGDTTTFLALGTSATGSLAPATDAGLSYNATTDALSTTTFIGALTGNVTGNVSGSSGSTTGNAATATALAANPSDCAANTFATTIAANGNLTCASILDADIPNDITVDTATLAGTVTVVDGTDATSFIGIYDSATGSLAPKTDGGLTYNATTGVLTATGFAGPLTGNVTGNVSGSSGSTTGNAATVTNATLTTALTVNTGTVTLVGNVANSSVLTLGAGASSFSGTSSGTNTGDQTSVTGNAGTVTFADAAGDTTTFLALGTSATGSLAPATDAGLSYNATTDALSTTTFIGALTGNVTGNVSGSSGSTTGNAATATALAANPSDCGANAFATTIAANGNLTCASILDADVPNNITVDLATLASAVTNATLTTALTVNTGTVTIAGNAANNSVLTLGAGASSVSGSNTGDQTSVTGNAGTVTFADAAGDTTTFLALGTSATGSLAPATDAGLSYNATTDALSTTTFIGALTGNVTGNVSGSSGSTTGNAATATALAANPSDCGANVFATTIAANGNLTCASLVDADVPNNITVDLATLATTVTTNANLTGDVTSSGNATTIGNDKILESMLKAVDAAGDEECLTYETTTGDFEWQTCGGGAGASIALDNLSGVAINAALVLGTSDAFALGSATKMWSDLFLADGAVINFNNGNFTATHSSGALTFSGNISASNLSGTNTGDQTTISGNAGTATALAANPTDCGANAFATTIAANGNLTCASIADADVPNNITVDLATLASTVTNATLTTALTVNTGTVTLIGNVANTSALTIGAGAVSVSGANTGDQTSVSGNAGTATALATARAINGVNFDGTAAITVTAAAGTLSGATLNSGVTASSLTSVGTLVSGATSTGFTIDLANSTLSGNVTSANISGVDISADTNLTAGDGTILTGDDVAVDLKTVGENAVGTTASVSGMEFESGQLTLLQGCADNEILKWDETDDDWNCEADNAGGGLSDADYGDITVSGTGTVFTIDTSAITTGKILDGTIDADDLDQATADGAPADEECLTFENSGGGDFEWQACGGGSFDSTAVDATTWSDGANASNVWTFDVSGTDHTMTAGNGLMTFGDAVTVTDTLTANSGIVIGAQADSATTGSSTATTNSAAGTFGSETNRDRVSSSIVYKGKLFVAVAETDLAGVYRYDGGTTWTLVTNATPGKAVTGDTANIDAFVMTVHGDRLYIGSQTGASTGAVYYSTTAHTTADSFTLLNATRGTFATAGQDGVQDMAVYNGNLIIATQETNAAEIVRYMSGTAFTQLNITDGKTVAETTADKDGHILEVFDGYLFVGSISGAATNVVATFNGGTNVAANWVNISVALTGGTYGDQTSMSDTNSMVVNNGVLYISMSKTAGNAAAVFEYQSTGLPIVATGATRFQRINTTVGKLIAGDTADQDSIMLYSYKGRLYGASTTGSTTGALYEYQQTGHGAEDWVLMNTTRGTFGSDVSIGGISTMVEYNDTLYLGSFKSNAASVYTWTKTSQNSYGLKFDSGSSNFAEISFVGGEQKNDNGGHYGTFIFSHAVALKAGGFDYAEDYPTYDKTLEPGDVVAIDPEHIEYIKRADGTTPAIGIFSKNPGLRLQKPDDVIETGETWVPVALVGRVPVKVSTENGPITAGDSLTLSATIPGVAMKSTKAGTIIARALGNYDGSEVGEVMAFIDNSYSNGSSLDTLIKPAETLDVEGIITLDNPTYSAKLLLAQFMEQKETLSESGTLSDVYVDRVAAGLEIITPTLIADNVETNTLTATNAIFTGKIIADSIEANTIKGLSIFTDQIASLSGQVADVADQGSAVDGLVNETVSAFAVTNASLATLQGLVEGLGTQTTGLSGRLDALEMWQTSFGTDALVFANGVAVQGGLSIDVLKASGELISIMNDAEFFGTPYFTKDTAGFAVINAGAREVEVVFDKQYLEQPIVNATITLENGADEESVFANDIRYLVTRKTVGGFTILLNKEATSDIVFSWTAFAVKNPNTFFSLVPESVQVSDSAPTPDPVPESEPESAPDPSPESEPETIPAPISESEPVIEIPPDPVVPVDEISESDPVPDFDLVI